MIFDSVDTYKHKRLSQSPSAIQRRGNFDVFTDHNGDSNPDQEEFIALCHIYLTLSFTDGMGRPRLGGKYEEATAAALAVQHFNSRNNTIISELSSTATTTESSVLQDCPVRLSLEMHDSEFQESVAVEQVIRATDRPIDSNSTIRPCGFLGASRSAVTLPTSLITSLRGFPQLSASSTSAALDDATQYPLFGRTVPADDGTAIPVIQYMRYTLGIQYMTILNVGDSYGSGYVMGLQLAARRYAPDLFLQQVDIPVDASPASIEQAVQLLRDTQNTFFFAIVYPTSTLDAVMTEAYEQGIAGTGRHNWFFSDATGKDIVSRSFPVDSPLHLAFQGAGLIAASAGLTGYNEKLDLLAQNFRSIKESPDDLEYLNESFPQDAIINEEDRFYVTSDDFLSSPGISAPFMYDATIAMGLAACELFKNRQAEEDLNGAVHFEKIVESSFLGASGSIQFSNTTGTRNPTSAFFSLNNHVIDSDRSDGSHVYFKQVLTDIYQNGEWRQLQEYIFNDGTSNTPPDLPPLNVDYNHLSSWLRILGFCLASIVVLMAAAFAVWTYKHQDSRVVKASQPIFLFILCAGAGIMAATIIPLGIDTGIASERGCDIACSCIPWFLNVGFACVASAIFTKTKRINMIFTKAKSFKRIVVTPMDVARPMFALLGTNLILLILWTTLDPLRWTVEVESKDAFGRATELRGRCNSDNRLPFLISLMAVNFGALAFAAYESHRSRRISTEFHETRYIFSAVFSILLVCLVGVPVAILAQDNTDALFFVFSAILAVSTCSILLFIFVPKIHYWKKSLLRQRQSNIRVSGLYNIEPGAFDDIAGGSFQEDDADDSERTGPEGDHGMRVLSFKSKEQLIRENHMLLKETKTLSAQNVNLRAASSRWSKMMSAERIEKLPGETEGLLDDEDGSVSPPTNTGAMEDGLMNSQEEGAIPTDEHSGVNGADPERAPLARDEGPDVGDDESRQSLSNGVVLSTAVNDGSSTIQFEHPSQTASDEDSSPTDDVKVSAWHATLDDADLDSKDDL